MNNNEAKHDQTDQGARQPYQVRLPTFITDAEEMGLGDVITRATASLGFRPCGGCEQRAAAFNRWLVFSGRRPG